MAPWLETIGVVLVALLGVFLGRTFSRFCNPYWTLGYFLSLLLIAVLIISRYADFIPFWAPITAGRVKFVILSLAIPMGLITPLSHLRRKSEKFIVCAVTAVLVTGFTVSPFLLGAFVREHLRNLETNITPDGICFQTSDYTCGPAAAVTALGKLGLQASEAELAVLSHSTPIVGTMPWSLCSALQDLYGPDGLKCQYQKFDSTAQLKDAGITLAVVRDGFLRDHCVAVIEVSDQTMLIADPAWGKKVMSHEQFEKIWRFSGIVLNRDPT